MSDKPSTPGLKENEPPDYVSLGIDLLSMRKLRKVLPEEFPDTTFSFPPADIVGPSVTGTLTTSSTPTTRRLPCARSVSVTSTTKGVKPPSCRPTSLPFR